MRTTSHASSNHALAQAPNRRKLSDPTDEPLAQQPRLVPASILASRERSLSAQQRGLSETRPGLANARRALLSIAHPPMRFASQQLQWLDALEAVRQS